MSDIHPFDDVFYCLLFFEYFSTIRIRHRYHFVFFLNKKFSLLMRVSVNLVDGCH